MADSHKYVYSFGGGKAEGKADMKGLLGGKGANLAEMSVIGIPVPPGFTITTEVCAAHYENGRKLPDAVPADPGDAVYVSGYGLVAPRSGPVLGAWAAALPPGPLLFMDPGTLVAQIPAAVLDAVLARCDWLSCNQREAALLTGALHEFGTLLGEAWTHKKRLSPLITNSRVDELYDLAVRKGALGGKLTGAGGGGYILLFCDFTKKHRVIEALELAGASVTEFTFCGKGMMTWTA